MASMTADNSEKWRLAASVAGKALDFGRGLIKPGAKLSDATAQIEKFIFDNGGKLGFPVNISFNQTAAHNVAKHNDPFVFRDELVKLDIGVHVDGWIGDNACTIDLSGKHKKLVDAPREALHAVVKMVKPGVKLHEVGKTVSSVISAAGFKPVRNLSGHTLDQFVVHAGLTIPNYDNGETAEFEEGMVFACEPFATDGIGLIHEVGQAEIFNLTGFKSTRVAFVRDIMKHIHDTYFTLPFSRRALLLRFPEGQVAYALKVFEQLEILHAYPPLVERNNGMVSQAEYTILVTKSGCEVLTKSSFSI